MGKDLRFEAAFKLKEKVLNKNLVDIAHNLGVTIFSEGRLNKGWIGQTLDKLIEVDKVNGCFPDGEDFELKSVKVVFQNDEWIPKETMAITMFNPNKILTEEFQTSALWKKLERLIIVGSYYQSVTPMAAYIKFIRPIDVNDPALVNQIKDYWEEIKSLTIEGKISSYSSKGTSRGFIQLRTKGSGQSESLCPVTGAKFKTRAYYATKPFLKYVWGVMS
ncbi:MAG: MutH/Sau3AI family endonuclease [Candidatus Caenarcaniphilales bacterium]|nr:MutH/Sau3AI family endonuclease [Candidatus Caenarcaniphilales bacterium]